MKYKTLITTIFLYFCLSGTAIPSALIFFCNTTSGKEIKLEKENSYILYSYGKRNAAPEIILKQKTDPSQLKLSEPEGSNIVTSIRLTNGDYTYEIFTSTDRMGPTHKFHSGMFVFKDNELLSRIRCINGSQKGNLLKSGQSG